MPQRALLDEAEGGPVVVADVAGDDEHPRILLRATRQPREAKGGVDRVGVLRRVKGRGIPGVFVEIRDEVAGHGAGLARGGNVFSASRLSSTRRPACPTSSGSGS